MTDRLSEIRERVEYAHHTEKLTDYERELIADTNYLLSELDRRERIERHERYWIYGTDNCKNCDHGRITLYATSGWCIECLHKKDSTK